MNRRDRKVIYRKAIRKWGMNAQLGMLMEECAELIQASHKVIRTDGKINQPWRSLAAEIADVEVVIDQIKIACDWQRLELMVETNKHDKLLKLKLMVDEE